MKGSSAALAAGRPLKRAEYEALPRRDTAFDGHGRRAFYGRYEQYEKALKADGHHDSLDIVLHVAARLARKPLYDALIVDEVQDFPHATIELLLRLASDPNATLWGGDTAQTIARTRFRFYKLADLLRRHASKPRVVELEVNYRSTQEVLDVSNVFVAALCSQFEGHVDKLPREVAPFRGNFKVRLLRGSDWEAIGDAVFGDGTREEVSEFGAQQCVIVPDEAAKRNLPPSFAGALCFTPLEAKGLEFHTAFILDAFRDTDAGWWQALAEDGRFLGLVGDAAAADGKPDPQLSADLARVAELKSTYVGVTRACVRLFFIDTNTHGRQPFYELLLRRDFAKWHEGQDFDEGLVVATSRRRWRARGDELLARIKEGDESIADQAALCFAKTGDKATESFCRGVEWRRAARREADEERVVDLQLAAACAFARGGALDACADLLAQLGKDDLADECRDADGAARLIADARAAERERAEVADRVVEVCKAATLATRHAASNARRAARECRQAPVSYTHLTLPTKRIG